jgi:hypothetical protein
VPVRPVLLRLCHLEFDPKSDKPVLPEAPR